MAEYPATCNQQHRYELNQEISPHNPAYSQMFYAFRIRSEVDSVVLRETFRQLEIRHEALRTTFCEKNNQVWQQIHAEPRDDFVTIDACSWSTSELEKQVALFIQGSCDLAKDAMLQTRLFSLAVDEHVLIFRIHHIVTDLWSMEVFFDELRRLYHALSHGLTPSLPQSRPFTEFSRWNNEVMQGENW